MIKSVIWFLGLLRPLFVHLGVNFQQMKAIVHTKLVIDNRIEKNGKSGQNTNNTLAKNAILMGIIGGFLFLCTYSIRSLSITTLIFQSYLSVMVMTGFMTEYARLLFNSVDNTITERFPVNDRTVLCARIVSMLSYLYLLTFSMSVFPYLLLIFKESFITAQLFFIAVLFNTLFSLLLANVFYIFLMRFLSAETFQKLITYVQIFLTIGVAFSYQYIGRITPSLIDFSSPALWLFFTPPAYFMAFTELFPYHHYFPVLLSGTGIALTFLLGIISLFCFSGSYIKKASALDKIVPVKRSKRKERIALFMSHMSSREILQQCGFLLTWRMTRDNLKFKQAIFPMMIYALIFNGLPICQLYTTHEQLHFSSFIFPIYMLPFMCMGVMMNLGYTERSNLLWIYKSRPLEHPGAFLLGSFKAIIIKYFLPFLIVIYTVYAFIGGIRILTDLLLALSLSTLFLIILYRYSSLVFPFSKEKSTRDSGSSIVKIFGTVFLLILLGLFHYILRFIPMGVITAIPLSWLFIYWGTKKIHSITFREIESHY